MFIEVKAHQEGIEKYLKKEETEEAEENSGLTIISKDEDTQEMNADTTNLDSDTTAISDEIENTEETVE
jgi:hypothetical protein